MVYKIFTWDQIKWHYNQGGLKIKGCKIEGALYLLGLAAMLCRSQIWSFQQTASAIRHKDIYINNNWPLETETDIVNKIDHARF